MNLNFNMHSTIATVFQLPGYTQNRETLAYILIQKRKFP